MDGSNLTNQNGVYGTQGVPANANTLGSRWASAHWLDQHGHLWLNGGDGLGEVSASREKLSDLWTYNINTGLWTWISGSKLGNQLAIFGMQSVDSMDNTPGARSGAAFWTDGEYNFWLLGGLYDDFPTISLGDLWKLDVPTTYPKAAASGGII